MAILQGTAGSTGTPKAARISPAAGARELPRAGSARRRRPTTAPLHSWLPIYHDMGLAVLLDSAPLRRLTYGKRPTSAFAGNPFGWLNWLHESRATMTAAPNMAFNIIGKYASGLSGRQSEPPRLHAQRRRARRL